jgi:BirA family biotin operon repressor/biotin-[acetyl-CoA-carboxylase] ligase
VSVPAAASLGAPHVHLRATTSTNDRARALAAAGAPHGTIVTAGEQSAGRGRQGRSWSAPPGSSLLLSVVVRDPPQLLPLAAGVAVARALGPRAAIKWPNDVLLAAADDPGRRDEKASNGRFDPHSETNRRLDARDAPPGRKVAGILVEGRPQEGWAVVGIGVNVAVRIEDLPAELAPTAATLGLEPRAVGAVRDAILRELELTLAAAPAALLDAWRERDALRGREVAWSGGHGTAAGVDGSGRLIVELPGGGRTELDAGEVHLRPSD